MNYKKYLFFTFTLNIFVTVSYGESVKIGTSKFNPRWLLVSPDKNHFSVQKKITNIEAYKEISFLKHLVENFYGGYFYFQKTNIHWKEKFDKLNKSIDLKAQVVDISWLLKEFHKLFQDVPDNHLRLGIFSSNRKFNYIKTYSNVPTNFNIITPSCEGFIKEEIMNQNNFKDTFRYLKKMLAYQKLVYKICRQLENKNDINIDSLNSAQVASINIKNLSHSPDQISRATDILENPDKFEYIILNLTGNIGGDPTNWVDWLGKILPKKLNIPNLLERKSMASLAARINRFLKTKNPLYKKLDGTFRFLVKHNIQINSVVTKEISSAIKQSNPFERFYPKFNGHLVVLQDRKCSSACELLIYLLKQYQKSFFIGNNTNGSLQIWNNEEFIFPYSGIRIYLGSSLLNLRALPQTFKFVEGIGFPPDLFHNNKDRNSSKSRNKNF